MAFERHQYLLDHDRILDAGNDLHRSAALFTGFIGHIPVPDRFAAVCDCANRLSCRFVDVDPEYTLEALSPGQGDSLFGLGRVRSRGGSLTPAGRRDPRAPAAVRGEHAMKSGEVNPWPGYERGQRVG